MKIFALEGKSQQVCRRSKPFVWIPYDVYHTNFCFGTIKLSCLKWHVDNNLCVATSKVDVATVCPMEIMPCFLVTYRIKWRFNNHRTLLLEMVKCHTNVTLWHLISLFPFPKHLLSKAREMLIIQFLCNASLKTLLWSEIHLDPSLWKWTPVNMKWNPHRFFTW